MMDVSALPVIDNHCHPMAPGDATLDPESLARTFYHGIGDTPQPSVRARAWAASDDLKYHLPYIGVVQTAVCRLAGFLGCAADLAAVAAERNRRTAEGLAPYARLLYKDAGIVATVLDSNLPQDDPTLALIPGRRLRLFQMDPALERQLQLSESFSSLLRGYQDALDLAVRRGFVGVKGHIAEQVGFGFDLVSEAEAEAAFLDAKRGDRAAFRLIYAAIFAATLRQCQELKVPVHVHSGITGGLWDGPIGNADPFLLAPLLRRPEFVQTRVVLLHAGYPWLQHAAALAHALPHVWVDLGWTTPWISLRLAECYRDVVGMAPLSKVVIGSGGHGTPEIAWLAAKLAKTALAMVLGEAVESDLLTEGQAAKVACMVLHDNAARLYGLTNSDFDHN